MTEFLFHEFDFSFQRIEVMRFIGCQQMTITPKSAVDMIFIDDLFNCIDRIK